MGLLNSALQIGRSALLSYQGALQVVGNNISGVASPDYTRLTPELDPLQGSVLARDIQGGAGVALTDIRRHVDEALENRVRQAVGVEQSTAVVQEALARLEVLFTDFDGSGLSSRLNTFLHSFDDLQNTPESSTVRDLAIANGRLLAEALQSSRRQLAQLSADFDGQIADAVATADELARRIAVLNQEITRAEAGRRSQATGLRDQRDGLLRDLGEIVDVTLREQPNGAINVYIGSEALVQGNVVRGLVAVTNVTAEGERTAVRFADSGQDVFLRGGRLAGLINARDRYGDAQIAALDELAAAIITEVNRIHADGQGLVGFTNVVGSQAALNGDATFSDASAGLPFTVSDGSFYVTVADDATGTPVAYRIAVQAGSTSLTSLATAINNQVEGVTATVTSDLRLAVTAEEGFSFTFGYDGQEPRPDTSGVLAALGINTFFTGTSARDMAVNPTIVGDPRTVAAATVFQPGDGVNAGRVAALDLSPSQSLGGRTLTEFYNALASAVAVAAAEGKDDFQAASSVRASLQSQRESLSGVNLDEEAVSMLKYERAFQGAARFVGVVDQLLDELVLLIR